MTIGKRSKGLLILGLIGVVFAFVYRWSPYKLGFIGHYDKVWAHRVNSVEKLESAIHFFEGVELDLVYVADKNVLDVNHPPAESIGLDFKSYLSVIDSDIQPFLWLDIKNLNATNAHLVHDRLIMLLEGKEYPLNKILVETTEPHALAMFSSSGFNTSYYLPSGLVQMSDEELNRNILSIQEKLEAQPSLGISSDCQDYNIMAKYFPDRSKYLWALLPAFHIETSFLKKPLNDETVKVMLIKYNALRGNR